MIIKADKNKVLKEFREKYVADRYKEELKNILENIMKIKTV
ncbi:putative house-cleaning noncanonical NTP pyrophosphatase (MazG superfamily) [Clostridium beijerinckii]|nr:putative house-cleaning noncanonical NTP pyrophosphatase (MazG superfamily) [Clostridium beijerinckii]